MIPDLELIMKTNIKYAKNLLGFKFKPAKVTIIDTANSDVQLGLI